MAFRLASFSRTTRRFPHQWGNHNLDTGEKHDSRDGQSLPVGECR